MSTVMRLGMVFCGFGAILLLIPLVDSSPDDAAAPIAGVLLIAGIVLLLVGANRRPSP